MDLRSAAMLVGIVLCAPSAQGIDLERLMMPGEVVAAHEELESDCASCHQHFDRDAQTLLCLDCHDEVAEDRESSLGFHGKVSTARDADCASCHTEHRGRLADIVGLDRNALDHGFTDFPLKGAHLGVDCAACHAEDRALREAPSLCVDCHSEVEPHDGALGTSCGDCHDEVAWRHVASFDHASTGFGLEGRHAEVRCGACHPDERWKGVPDDCVSCHVADDAHRGSFGRDCGACHDPSGWKGRGFDHDRDTRFALAGAHQRAACQSCHVGDPRKEDLPVDCRGCHLADDDHRGAYGSACGECHGVSSWSRVSFQHDRDTDFPLRGSHGGLRCESCHQGPPREVATDAQCIACHAADDVHRAQLGRDCALCHDESTWSSARFDHEITRFPLLGLHAVASCEQCHATQAFRDASTECVSCHRGDDAHEGSLGEACQSCHNPNDWRIWAFDHGLQTSFELEGAHEGLACGACHTRAMRPGRTRSDCGACHQRDDAHRGALGNDCGRCHEATFWREVRVR